MPSTSAVCIGGPCQPKRPQAPPETPALRPAPFRVRAPVTIRSPARPRPATWPRALGLAAGLACAAAWGQPALPERDPPRLPLAEPAPLPAVASQREGRDGPIRMEADRVEGQAGRGTIATGRVDLRRGDLRVQADRLRLDPIAERVQATGQVQVQRSGDRFAGSSLELSFDGDEGFLLLPRYYFSATAAGGRAERIDLLGAGRLSARGATYTSCPECGRITETKEQL